MIERINPNLPNNIKIERLNEQILEVDGKVASGKFDKNELDQIFNDIGFDRKYKRNIVVGNTISSYVNWTPVIVKGGYTIWKYALSNYKHSSENVVYFDDKKLLNRGEAGSELANYFDKVYSFDELADSGVGVYTDYTDEAKEETETFNILDNTNTYLLLGMSDKFNGFSIKMSVIGIDCQVKVEYWNSGWKEITVQDNDLVSTINDLQSSSGVVYWSNSGLDDWQETSFNDVTKYWIRISTVTEPSIIPEVDVLRPYNSVEELLALNSDEIISEKWAFCSYLNSVYITIRNTGNSSTEGDYFIKDTSSVQNKINYFVHNHKYTSDYLDSTYVTGGNLVFGGSITALDFKGGSENHKKYAVTTDGLEEITWGWEINWRGEWDSETQYLRDDGIYVTDSSGSKFYYICVVDSLGNEPPSPQYWIPFNFTIDLNEYAKLSGAIFTGDISANNLSGINTGDELPVIDSSVTGKYLSNDGENVVWVNPPESSNWEEDGEDTIKPKYDKYIDYDVIKNPPDLSNLVEEALEDGKQYVRKDGAWEEIVIPASSERGTFTLDNLVYTFTIATPTVDPTAGATYTNNTITYTVVSYANNLLVCTGTGYPTITGTLTKTGGTGDDTLTFSNYQATLTVTHNLGLSAPYSVCGISIFNNVGKQILPDDITSATNSFVIDLTSFRTLTGTNGYIYLKG